MKRGKSKMQSRKNLLKGYARDAAKSAKYRTRKQKLAYQKESYDGYEDDMEVD